MGKNAYDTESEEKDMDTGPSSEYDKEADPHGGYKVPGKDDKKKDGK